MDYRIVSTEELISILYQVIQELQNRLIELEGYMYV